MRKNFTALRMLLLIAGIGLVSLGSAATFTLFSSWVTSSAHGTLYLYNDHESIQQRNHRSVSTHLASENSIRPMMVDTFRIGLSGGSSIQTCLDLGGVGHSIQNIRHCGVGQTALSITAFSGNCLTINVNMQLPFAATDTFCAQNCTSIECRDVVLIFNSVARNPPCGAISPRSLITINTASCSTTGCYCFADSIDINELRNNYTITDNGVNYAGGYRGCNFDTIYSYTYFTVPNMGRRGPYRLDSWLINGVSRSISSFNTMQQLVDSMNVWDSAGNWTLDTTVFAIAGGSTRNTYGQMKITRLANRAFGILELNLGIISQGIQMCFNRGDHLVIFRNNTTGCTDTITVKVVCPDTTPRRPQAVDDLVMTTKNRATTITALSNDVLNGNLIRPLSIIRQPRRGTATVASNQITYTPQQDFCGGVDTLSYEICNATGCDTADVFVTVNCDTTSGGTRLVAVDDRITTPKNTTIRFRPINNDTIVNGLLAMGVVTTPRHGSIGFIGTDSLIYTPNNGYCGLDTMEYRICNNAFECDTATIFITVTCDTTGGNQRPIAVDDVATTTKNTPTNINILANDQVNGTLSRPPVVVSLPQHGSTSWLNNQMVYTPDTDYCGSDVFTYEICNANGCDTALVTVTIRCDSSFSGTRLVAVDDRISTPKNTALGFKPTQNDTIVGTLNEVSLITSPVHGTISFVGLDSLIYTPDYNYCGNDTFDYRICNNLGACDTGRVFINVTCGNDTITTARPNAVDDFAQVRKGQMVTVNIMGNDTLNGALTRIALVRQPSNGVAQLIRNQIKYTPNLDFCGSNDTLSYEICNSLGCDTAIVVYQVSCDTTNPQKPIAVDDATTTKKNQAITINVLNNDILNGTLVGSVRLVSLPSRGTATVTNNQISYTPQLNFCGGNDTLTYEICNAVGCDTAQVIIAVTCDTILPTRLVAVDDRISTPKNTTIRFRPINNDTLVGNLLAVGVVTAPRHGSIAFSGTDSLIYTPDVNYCGLDTMEYRLCNTDFVCDTATIFITVTCDTTPTLKPNAVDDVATTKKNQSTTISVLNNDVLNGTLTSPVRIIRTPRSGTATVTNNQINYTPQDNFCGGNDTLTYEICNAVGCDTAQVVVTITCDTTQNLRPDAINDISTTKKNQSVTVNVLNNDVLNGTLTGTVRIISNPRLGTASVDNNQIVYTPNRDTCGFNDTLSYAICNAIGCDTALVIITVNCDTTQNLKPNAVNDFGSTKKNQPLSINVLGNDILNGALVGTVRIVSAARRGTATVTNNQINYTPNRDTCGFTDTLSYEICNAIGCDTADVIVTVTCDTTNPNTRPLVAVDDRVMTDKNTSLTIRPTLNDTIRNRLLALSIVTLPRHGSVSFSGLDTVIYSPGRDFCGLDTFEYRICDTTFACDTAFVFINVKCDTAPKLLPIAINDLDSTLVNTAKIINVLSNDTLNGILVRPLSIVGQPTFGTVTVNNNGTISYKPFAGFCGANDKFRYEICNDNGCDTAEVTVIVKCDSTVLNKLPVAEPDVVTARKNTPIRIVILGNDTLNGTLDSIKIISSPLFGTAILGNDNVITYTPDSCGFTDSLIYRICNRNGCDTALVTIKVVCDTLFRKPIAVDDTARTSKNRSVVIAVVGNDSLFSAGLDTIYISKNPVRGTAIIERGDIRYLPQTDSCGYRDTFSYVICTRGGCDTADVVVNVLCQDDLAPEANYDTARTKSGQAIIIAVTNNDSLRGADTFRITRVPLNGIASFDTLNRLKYTPNPSFCGKDTLIYEICNRNGCDTALVTIVVDCVPPIAIDDSAKTRYNQFVSIPIVGNDTLNGADTIVVIKQPTRGLVSINADKTATYTPSLNFCGRDSFLYVICNTVGCDSAWVRIEVSCGDSIIIYNAVSHNDDGKNDGFYIRGIENYPDNEVIVFNRWGNEVFRKKGYRNDDAWKGIWNGFTVPDGTYFYCIYLNDAQGQRFIGYLQLMK
ncbi:MAG: gliding motility-associated C-terminal domain-containing protein [Saprospiraceae bacterium]|nr:gliding motility-associated C-terminal domain-containing protein [Saprospiraceae bacterium]